MTRTDLNKKIDLAQIKLNRATTATETIRCMNNLQYLKQMLKKMEAE